MEIGIPSLKEEDDTTFVKTPSREMCHASTAVWPDQEDRWMYGLANIQTTDHVSPQFIEQFTHEFDTTKVCFFQGLSLLRRFLEDEARDIQNPVWHSEEKRMAFDRITRAYDSFECCITFAESEGEYVSWGSYPEISLQGILDLIVIFDFLKMTSETYKGVIPFSRTLDTTQKKTILSTLEHNMKVAQRISLTLSHMCAKI